MKSIYLMITPFFPTNESFRGPYIYDQVKAVNSNSNFEVIVIKLISMLEKNNAKSYIYQNTKVYNFIVYDFPSSVLPGLFQTFNLHRLEKFIKNTINIPIPEIKYIHSHVIYPAGILGVALGDKYNIKNFIQHHGFDVFQNDNGRILKGWLRRLNHRYMHHRFVKIVNKTNLNIGVSQKVIDKLQEIEGYNNLQNYVLYNGVDTDKFYKVSTLKTSNIFIIGCIANFWELKDHLTLLKALKLLVEDENKNILIKFIGSGPTLKSCKEYIQKNKLEQYTEFLQELDHTELNMFYNSLDLFVLPSYYEAFGCVYSEALQVGVPIIGVNNQGIEEILIKNDKQSMLIQKGNYIDLANKISLFKNKSIEYNTYDLDINILIKKFLNDLEEKFDEKI